MGRDNSSKLGKRDLKKYGAQVRVVESYIETRDERVIIYLNCQVRDKIEVYKKMREEIASLRAELATLQRTEQILKSKHQHLDAFLSDLEKKRGVEVPILTVHVKFAALTDELLEWIRFHCNHIVWVAWRGRDIVRPKGSSLK